MAQAVVAKPEYAAWVSAKLVIVPLVLGVFLGGLSWISLWFAPLAVLAFGCGGYFAYAQRTFSTGGGDVQSNVQGLILDRLRWRGGGEVLDIGCGNGRLAIAIAKTYPNAHVTGVDRWGSSWEFSKAACERNAAAEGVAERVTFLEGERGGAAFRRGGLRRRDQQSCLP